MNSKLIVKISNIIGLASIVILLYWTFTFISIEVFGLKVFKENITETFYLSILGILGLMAGSLIINIMFNMTRIAEKHNNDNNNSTASYKRLIILSLLSFPLLFAFLYFKDYSTKTNKEKLMIDAAKSIVEKNKTIADYIVNYSFTEQYIINTSDYLEIIQKTDKYFPYCTVIAADTLNATLVYITISDYHSCDLNDTILPNKLNFLRPTSKEERDYLYSVFKEQNNALRFSSYDGRYELFYPYRKGDKIVVFYFSDYNRYGK
jgi:hypothetical protein